MTHAGRRSLAAAITIAAGFAALGSPLRAQQEATVAVGSQSAPVTIGDLVAPVALYPDQLLGQVLVIAATPQEVLDLGNWLIENDTLTGGAAQDAAKAAGFSVPAQYLALFPQVVDNMCQQIDWTTQLGNAYTDTPKDVMAAIQAKRAEAIKAGTLKSGKQLTVTNKKGDDGKTYIEITPTDPKVIYVPVYNPVTVYVQTPAPAAAPPTTVVNTTVVVQQQSGVSSADAAAIGILSFGVGMMVGAAIHTNYYPYPVWGYGGMWYGGHPWYPPPYRPPYYPGYRPVYGYHPPASYHWNQVNRQTNITINNNNYYNNINNNSNNRYRNSNNSKNASRPGQLPAGNRGGGAGEYKGARPSTNDRAGGGMANNRPGAGGAGTANANRPGASGAGAGSRDVRPGAGGGGVAAGNTRPGAGGGDRGYGGAAAGGGAAGANRPAPQNRPQPQATQPQARPAPQARPSTGGGTFGSAGGGSGSSARAASSRGHASAGSAHGGGGGGGRRR